jgi:hypothetical protein
MLINWKKHENQIHASVGKKFCVVSQWRRVLSVYFGCGVLCEFASVDAAIGAIEDYLSGHKTAQQIVETQIATGLAEFQTLEALKCPTP